MALTTEQQIFEQLGKATKILIAIPEHLTADTVGSSLALMRFLRKMEKEVDVASSGSLPDILKFLPEVTTIKSSLSNTNSLVVVLNTANAELDQVSYHQEDDHVNIYLKPKAGIFTSDDITFSSDRFPYDLIIVLGARSLDDLGVLFEQQADVFFETPKINIDNHAGNDFFGAINLTDINASSVAEILASLFEKYETQLVDEDIATCLLAGIISKTHSFQHAHTTPRAFTKASELIGLGGRQQEIIKYLFKTKSLPLLRLWGRALARIKMEDQYSLVYSLLNLSDFGKSGAGNQDLEAVLCEMVENISSYKFVALISETLNAGVHILLAVHSQVSPEEVIKALPGAVISEKPLNGLYTLVELELSSIPLTEAETKLIEAVQTV